MLGIIGDAYAVFRAYQQVCGYSMELRSTASHCVHVDFQTAKGVDVTMRRFHVETPLPRGGVWRPAALHAGRFAPSFPPHRSPSTISPSVCPLPAPARHIHHKHSPPTHTTQALPLPNLSFSTTHHCLVIHIRNSPATPAKLNHTPHQSNYAQQPPTWAR